MFYVVERSIIVIKPRQPFLEWINKSLALSDDTFLTLDGIRIDCNSYLIPEVDEIEDGVSYVDDVYEALFRMELASWTEDQALWPQELSLKMFWEWFDVEISPTLIDLTDTDEINSDDTEDGDTEPVDTFH